MAYIGHGPTLFYVLIGAVMVFCFLYLWYLFVLVNDLAEAEVTIIFQEQSMPLVLCDCETGCDDIFDRTCKQNYFGSVFLRGVGFCKI